MTKSILDCVPSGYVLRDIQRDFLLYIEKNFHDKDVIVGNLPVAAGKSLCLITIANWCADNGYGDVSGIVPTLILQDQYQQKHPEIHMLKGMRHYECHCYKNKSCAEAKAKNGKLCTPKETVKTGHECCRYIQERNIAIGSSFSLFNFHSMSYNNIFKKVLICDEGHNARNYIIDRFSVSIWKHEESYPKFKKIDDFYNNGDRIDIGQFSNWLKKLISEKNIILQGMRVTEVNQKIINKTEQEIERLESVYDAIESKPDSMLILRQKSKYRTVDEQYHHLDNTDQERIFIKPLNLKQLAETYLWPTGFTNKIIFLSATFNEIFLKELGLDNSKYGIFKGKSPIPKERREIRYWPIASMSWKNREQSIPKITKACLKIAEKHNDTKGLIHCSYEVASEIRNLKFQSNQYDRFIFHGKQDKQDKYDEFLTTKYPSILIASGMNEGIDLPDDLCRWQVITMLMRPNLSDPVNMYILKTNQELYDYLTILNLEQQTGRITRNPTDFGYTYIIVSDFGYFYKKTHSYREYSMWDEWFSESLVYPRK